MNPGSSPFLYVAAAAFAILALVLGLMYSRYKTTLPEIDGLRPASRWRRRSGFLGAALIAIAFVADLEAHRRPLSSLRGDEEITTVVGPTPDSSFRKLQFVCAIYESGFVSAPRVLREATLDFENMTSYRTVEIDDLGLTLAFAQFRGDWPAGAMIQISVRNLLHVSSSFYAGDCSGAEVSIGDGRPFHLLPTSTETSFGLTLRNAANPRLAFFVRPLYDGDVLERVPAAAVAEKLAAAWRAGDTWTEAAGRLPVHESSSLLARLFAETDVVGGALLLVGLLLIVMPLRSIPGVAGVLFGALAVLSLSARMDVAREVAHLEAPLPKDRIAAAARIASESAFIVPAGRALRERFEREPDDEVRAAILLAIATNARAALASRDVVELLSTAMESETSPVVRKAAERARAVTPDGLAEATARLHRDDR